jgi:hypothetical protein
MLDLPLRQVTLTCGTRLTKKIQLRVGNLNQAFQFYMRQIDAEERVRDISDAEWTHRSAWWMKLSMWVPKRVEYIEKFLQTEMQRTRIFMLWSGTVGRLIAMAIVLIGAVLALSFVATRSGVAFGAMLNPSVWLPVLATASVSMWAGWRVLRSDNYFVAALAASLAALFAVFVWATGMALNPTSPDLFWLAIGALVSVVVARASIESSVSLSDIATALTKEPLGLNSRFADIRLHDELGEQIRKDKETIRQERLRGGGIGQGGGRP